MEKLNNKENAEIGTQTSPLEGKEADTLLIYDKEKQSIQAVKEPDKSGKLRTVEPKKENNPEFIKLDKHGDFLSNFYANFMQQLKDPTRFRLFKVPSSKIEFFGETIKSILKDTTPAGEAMLKQYEVRAEDLKQNNKQNQHNEQNTREKQETAKNTDKQHSNRPQNTTNPITPTSKTMDTTNTASDYRYKVEDIDWKTLESMGVSQEKLQKMNLLDDLLKGFKTNQLVPISLNMGSVITHSEARLSLQPGDNGRTVVALHGVRKEPLIHQPFFGHEFTPEDKKNLLQTGNMGRIVPLENRKTGELIPSIISVDRLTNELVALRADKIKIPDEIKGLKLTEEQKQTLQEGKPLYLEGMISRKGTEFNATVQFNADKRYVEFLFDRGQQQNIRQTQTNGEAPRFVRGKELNDEQYAKFKSGQTIYVDDLVDKKGQTYKGYLTFNVEKGKTEFSFGNANKQKNAAKQSAKPDEASKVQKAVNSDGKTNEATKNVKEPLKQGQVKPTEKQAEKQQNEEMQQKKSRGRKM